MYTNAVYKTDFEFQSTNCAISGISVVKK